MRELFAENKEKVYENLWKFNTVKKVSRMQENRHTQHKCTNLYSCHWKTILPLKLYLQNFNSTRKKMSFALLEELSQLLYTMVQKTGALNSSKAEIKKKLLLSVVY